jgi:predicted nucleic acid-binding protein
MISRCNLIPVDEAIAIKGAKFRHERDWGLEDALIYATATLGGAKVLTGDHHFEGLRDVIFQGINSFALLTRYPVRYYFLP